MTKDELLQLVSERPHIEWAWRDESLFLRDNRYDDENSGVKLSKTALDGLTPNKLESILVNGRNVDQITRVTGYFAKVSGFNKGKRGELNDRDRVEVA